MNRKVFIKTVLFLLIAASVFNAGITVRASGFTDIEGHWAKEYILWNVEKGYFSGTSDTQFSPDGIMTRGMFVTVLARLAGESPDDYRDWFNGFLFEDVPASAYYAPNVSWAVRYGIAAGTAAYKFSPDQPVTREQAAALILKFLNVYDIGINYSIDEFAESFSDMDAVAGYAKNAVLIMKKTGLITGRDDGKGGYVFDPGASLTRAECAVILKNITEKKYHGTAEKIMPESVYIITTTLSVDVWDSVQFDATVFPENASNQTVIWFSTNPSVAQVDLNGKITAYKSGSADIYALTCNGKMTKVEISTVDKSLAFDGETYEQKCIRIYGKVVKDPRNVYTKETSAANMTEITVRVWDFKDSTQKEKITKNLTLTVNKNLASTIKAIFEDIYNGKEKFPIKSLGCYRWQSGSEHNAGMAIDVNPFANYMIDNGRILSGDHWTPGVDPYSIPLEGDVVSAFAKYGFSRGFWGNRKDYMHFSYFGT